VDPALKRHPAERPALRLTGAPPVIAAPGKAAPAVAKPAGAPKPAAAPAAARPAPPRTVPPKPMAPPPAAAEGDPVESLSPEFLVEMEAMSQKLDTIDYFEVFKLPRTATPRDIKDAYYNESRAFHPDRFSRLGDEAVKEQIGSIFKRITEAYVVLRDDRKRAKYLSDIGGAERDKKLRYTEASEAEQKAEAKKAIEEQVGTTPKGRECWKNAMKEFDAKRWDGALRQLKMALMYEPANAKYKDKFKEAEKEAEKSRPKDDFRIK
jgi:DnaJ-domain-containing protein 1